MTRFFDFLNNQFRLAHKQSDEDHDLKNDLFILEVSFKIL